MSELKLDTYICINGHRHDHANLAPSGIKMCATPGCRAEAEIETAPDSWPLVRELCDAALPFNKADLHTLILPSVSSNEVEALTQALARATAALKRREGVGG